jgi:hypothetical protein
VASAPAPAAPVKAAVAVVAAKTKTVAKPNVVARAAAHKPTSSNSDDSASSESDDDESLSGSDDSHETSSEEDDDDDDVVRRTPVAPSALARVPAAATAATAATAAAFAVTQAAVPVGVLVSSPARVAVERLEAALAAIDDRSAPLGAQDSLRRSKEALCQDTAHSALERLKSGARLDDASVNAMLLATSLIASQLAAVAAGPPDVDYEVQAFRRLAQTVSRTWHQTMPQIEDLAASAREQKEAAAATELTATRLLGAHSALASTVASALEGLQQQRIR